MRISKEYFNQLNPSYQTAIKELEQKLDECNSDKDEELRTLLEFSTIYLMPKEYWKMVFDSNDEDHEKLLNRNARKAYYHFYYVLGANNLSHIDPQEKDLTFPHSHLFACFTQLEIQSNRSLSNELVALYEMNKRYYEKIRAAEEDVVEWFKLLCEAEYANNDHKIFTHNVEYRLGSNLLNTKLWKLYIEYLKKYDSKEMLQVYSKYCRFFLDDTEMKERYKKEVAKYGPVYVCWKNLFDFEEMKVFEDDSDNNKEDDNNKFESEYTSTSKSLFLSGEPRSPSSSSFKVHSSDMKKLCGKFYNTYKNQEFPFMTPLISYILNNANLNLLRKLYASCKYFYARKQVPIIHRLSYTEGPTQIVEESIEFGNEKEKLPFLKNSYVATTFNANNLFKSSVTAVISKMYRCGAKYIYIQCGLSFNEIRFLIESGNVVIFYWTREMDLVERMKQACLKDINHNELLPLSEDKTNCNLEDILCYMPKIEDLEISPVSITSQTFTTLLNQKFTSKIQSLELYPIHGEAFDPEALIEFCVKNRASRFILRMYFH